MIEEYRTKLNMKSDTSSTNIDGGNFHIMTVLLYDNVPFVALLGRTRAACVLKVTLDTEVREANLQLVVTLEAN